MYQTFSSFTPQAQGTPWPSTAVPMAQDQTDMPEHEEVDNARRPPNAFILYTQAMRSQVRQENPSLSNTEVSSLLGKMWKEVPNDEKLQYKQQASALQEEFKRAHPDYTYRKARRKRALNELITKSSHIYPQVPGAMFASGPNDPNQWNPQMFYGYSMGQGSTPGTMQSYPGLVSQPGQMNGYQTQPSTQPQQNQLFGINQPFQT